MYEQIFVAVSVGYLFRVVAVLNSKRLLKSQSPFSSLTTQHCHSGRGFGTRLTLMGQEGRWEVKSHPHLPTPPKYMSNYSFCLFHFNKVKSLCVFVGLAESRPACCVWVAAAVCVVSQHVPQACVCVMESWSRPGVCAAGQKMATGCWVWNSEERRCCW